MEFVPYPLVIKAPAGSVQVYEVAPVTAETEYVTPASPEQALAEPVIAPGVNGE